MAGLELAFDLAPDETTRLMQAQDEVRGFCGWHIAPSRTETVRVEGGGGRLLLLPSLHVTDVASVVDENGSEVTDFRWRRNGTLVGCWSDCLDYDVTFTHGHPQAPMDVSAAVQAIGSGDVALGVVKSWNRGPFGESYSDSRESAVRATLDRYKLPPRP